MMDFPQKLKQNVESQALILNSKCINKLQKEDMKTLNSKLITLNSYGKNFFQNSLEFRVNSLEFAVVFPKLVCQYI